MGIQYENLDARVRELMVQEIQLGGHYQSPRLTADGLSAWPGQIEAAAAYHNDDWLAAELIRHGHIVHSENYKRNGNTHTRKVNVPAAAEQLAEGEFNRYYVRALCLRAAELGMKELIVYRGKAVAHPRPESQALIGRRIPIDQLLPLLRSNDFVSIESALGLKVPGGPNSGITCRLPREGEQTAS